MQISGTFGLERLARHADALLAVGVLVILMMMVVPLPTWLMDIMLATSIAVGVIVLLTSLYVLKPMDFSVFPSLLLLTTLFRLSLNVATTRLILLHGSEGPGAAGHVIESFGQFVVGGNMVVGMIIFLILVLINFIVITKGATRIAEVAARFTLDAMPGKQMAIDADLNAGIIDEQAAKQRRQMVAKESEFFGAMDGASKFVRGDAVAGLIITAINIIGGLLIGVLQQGMGFSEAVTTYSILTVGDGLVSQLPALVISTGAGILITRAGSGATLFADLATQFTGNPRIYIITSGALFLLALVPGMPTVPFLLLATGIGVFGWYQIGLAGVKQAEPELIEAETASSSKPAAPSLTEVLNVDPLLLEVGYGLIDLVELKHEGGLLDRLQAMRRQLANESGFMLPPVHIKDNLQLGVGDYRILIRGAEIARGEIRPRHLLALEGEQLGPRVEGVATEEPAFGLPALWITQEQRQQAELSGYTVVDPPTVIVTHINELVRRHAYEIMDRAQVREMLDALSERTPKLVDEMVPNPVSLGLLQQVLQRLLAEWVPIRDLMLILETLADVADVQKDIGVLTEIVRTRLGRSIVQPYLTDKGELQVFTLTPEVEAEMSDRLSAQPDAQLPLDVNRWQRLITRLSEATAQHDADVPVILTTPRFRPGLARALAQSMKRVAVLSVGELPDHLMINNVMSVGLNE